jgi:type I restriction enzyme, S subunit
MNPAHLLAYFDRISDAPDAIPYLRRLILALAVRGKLIQQEPNDEPAIELLKRIQAETAGGVSTRNGKRQEVLPVIGSSEIPFLVPEGWLWLRFGSIHDLIRGVTYTKSDVADSLLPGYLPILRANNIGESLNFNDLVFVRKGCVGSEQMLRRGDYLIALSSGSKNLVGKAAFVASDFEGGFGGFCGVVRLASPALEPFVGVYLSSSLYRESIAGGSRGIGINNLKKETLSNILFPLPPLAEQRRIVAKVDELMALCNRLEVAQMERESRRDRLTVVSLRRVSQPVNCDLSILREHSRFFLDHLPYLTAHSSQIQQIRLAVLDLAVKGRLVPQRSDEESADELLRRIHGEKLNLIQEGKAREHAPLPVVRLDEVPFALPVGWVWARLGTVCYQITDGAHHTPNYHKEGIPFLSVKDVSGGAIDFSDTRFISEATHRELCKRCKPGPGDILLTKVGTTGTAVRIDTNREFSIFVSLALLKFSQSNLDGRYLCYLINSPVVRQQSADNTQGIGNKNLVLRLINRFVIPLPPLAEQHRIVRKIEELLTLCDLLEDQLTTRQAERHRLLKAALHTAISNA